MNHEHIARELLATITVVRYDNDTGTQFEARLGGNDPVLTCATVISPSMETAVLRMRDLVIRHVVNRGTCPPTVANASWISTSCVAGRGRRCHRYPKASPAHERLEC